MTAVPNTYNANLLTQLLTLQWTVCVLLSPFVPRVMENESSVLCRCACAALAGHNKSVTYSDV